MNLTAEQLLTRYNAALAALAALDQPDIMRLEAFEAICRARWMLTLERAELLEKGRTR